MPPPKDEKKKIAECQKAIHGEAQKLSLKMRNPCKTLDQLVAAKDKIEAAKEVGPKEKDTLQKIEIAMVKSKKDLENIMAVGMSNIDKVLMKMAKEGKKETEILEKGMDKSFLDKIQKQLSFPAGKNLTLRFDLNFKALKKLKKFDVKTMIELPLLKGKF